MPHVLGFRPAVEVLLLWLPLGIIVLHAHVHAGGHAGGPTGDFDTFGNPWRDSSLRDDANTTCVNAADPNGTCTCDTASFAVGNCTRMQFAEQLFNPMNVTCPSEQCVFVAQTLLQWTVLVLPAPISSELMVFVAETPVPCAAAPARAVGRSVTSVDKGKTRRAALRAGSRWVDTKTAHLTLMSMLPPPSVPWPLSTIDLPIARGNGAIESVGCLVHCVMGAGAWDQVWVHISFDSDDVSRLILANHASGFIMQWFDVPEELSRSPNAMSVWNSTMLLLVLQNGTLAYFDVPSRTFTHRFGTGDMGDQVMVGPTGACGNSSAQQVYTIGAAAASVTAAPLHDGAPCGDLPATGSGFGADLPRKAFGLKQYSVDIGVEPSVQAPTSTLALGDMPLSESPGEGGRSNDDSGNGTNPDPEFNTAVHMALSGDGQMLFVVSPMTEGTAAMSVMCCDACNLQPVSAFIAVRPTRGVTSAACIDAVDAIPSESNSNAMGMSMGTGMTMAMRIYAAGRIPVTWPSPLDPWPSLDNGSHPLLPSDMFAFVVTAYDINVTQPLNEHSFQAVLSRAQLDAAGVPVDYAPDDTAPRPYVRAVQLSTSDDQSTEDSPMAMAMRMATQPSRTRSRRRLRQPMHAASADGVSATTKARAAVYLVIPGTAGAWLLRTAAVP